jgi:hypothetical protein
VNVAIAGVWVLLAFAAVLCVVLRMAWATRRRRGEPDTTTGRAAVGRVLAMGRDDDALGGSSYWLKVEYDYDRVPVTVKVQISWRDKERYRVGQRIGLTFVPGRPQIVRLDPPEWAAPKAL